jgi:hypothetical protein
MEVLVKRSTLYLCRLVVTATVLMLAMPAAGLAAGQAGSGINTPSMLIIQAIRCNNQNDDFGDDEPFIEIDGLGRVWEAHNVDEGQWIGIDRFFPFDGQIVVHMWEDDGSWTGRDDHLGTWVIPDTLRGAYDSFFYFRGYTMWITVRDP